MELSQWISFILLMFTNAKYNKTIKNVKKQLSMTCDQVRETK
jgi:hypothetical protein